MKRPEMGAFWDAKARENAAFFVDDTLDYADSDLEAFWDSGPAIVDGLLELMDAPAIEPTDDVVEIGCGIGRLTRVLAQRARSVRALDVSAEMLARANAHNPEVDVEWLLGDGTSMTGVDDASADVVFSYVVFQHIPDPAITLGYVREIGRVLRPGGWAGIHVSNDPSVHHPHERGLRQRWRVLTGRAPKGTDHPAWLGSAVELDALRAVADSGGLDVENVFGEGTQFCLVVLRRRAD